MTATRGAYEAVAVGPSATGANPLVVTAPKRHKIHPPPGEYGECICTCAACQEPETLRCLCVECCATPKEKR